MKTLLILATLCGLALNSFAGDAVGKYQLFTGSFEVTGKNGFHASGVFRLDTTTGKTWLYSIGKDKDGKNYEFWSEIEETPKPF